MIAETDIPSFPEKPDSGFEGKDYTIGVEMDDSQEWIGELLAERVRRIDTGEERVYSLEETMKWLEDMKESTAGHGAWAASN